MQLPKLAATDWKVLLQANRPPSGGGKGLGKRSTSLENLHQDLMPDSTLLSDFGQLPSTASISARIAQRVASASLLS